MYIYRITNILNGHFYIGQTTKTLKERLNRHFYSAKYGSETHLHRAMRKYGFDSFIIEEIESDVNDLNEAEIKYIAKLTPHYNMTPGGEGGHPNGSPNFRKAMKKYHASKKPSDYATYGMLGKSHPGKGKRQKGKPVSCDGIRFDSIQLAQDHFKGISVRKRLANDKYPNFYRL